MNYDIMNLPATVDPKTFTTAGSTYDNIYYDHVTLKTGTKSYSLYTAGINDPDPVTSVAKNLADTNFPGKKLDDGVAIFVYGNGLKYQNFAKKDVDDMVLKNKFINGCFYESRINSRQAYGEGTLDYMMGNADDQVIELAATNDFAYQNVGQQKGFVPLNYIIPLARQTSWSVQLTPFVDSDVLLDNDRLKWELVNITNRMLV